MAETHTPSRVPTPPAPAPSPGWKVAAVVTGVIAAVGFALGLFVAKRAFIDGNYQTRTVWGVAAMAAGVAGLLVPLAFVRGRHQFVRL